MPILKSLDPIQPYEDPLLYDKAKIVMISHFVDKNFITSSTSRSVDLLHCIRSRTADNSDKLMLKRELFQLLPIASEYIISSGIAGDGKFFVRLKHKEMLQEFVLTKDGLSNSLDSKSSEPVIESNFTVTNLAKQQLLDELIRAFPYQDFSFLS